MKKLLHAAVLGAAAGLAAAAPLPAPARPGHEAAAPSAPAPRPCTNVRIDPPTTLALGKSQVIPLDFPAARVIVGGRGASPAGRPAPEPATGARNNPLQRELRPGPNLDGVADTEVQLLGPTELFFLAHRTGTMNVVLQGSDGRCAVKDIVVTVDPSALQAKLAELLPGERGIQVRGADGALVLTGSVSDAIRLDQAMALAGSYGDGKRVVNLLRVDSPQQVMLEVKIAEVSKTILDHLGLDFSRMVTSASGATTSLISGIIGGGAGLFGQFNNLAVGGIGGSAQSSASNGSSTAGATLGSIGSTQVQNPDGSFANKLTFTPGTVSRSANLLGVNAQKKDGIIRVLAEPNIMAVSGQTASFLSGGKIFIPVAQNRDGGGAATFTLEEKEFGVGLKFTPTVLDGGRVNLKLVSEASELSQTGSPFTSFNGVTAILPSLATRRVDTTVQLGDGQSFVVAGLIKNNLNQAVDKVPGLGEVPVMGALFRSTEFQTDQTELMFVVTPHLVKPLAGPVVLPTDLHVPPTRNEVMLMGTGESARPAEAPPAPTAPAQPAPPAALPAPVPGKP